jgi:hypothetical protein
MEQYHSATAAYRVPTSSSISDMDPEKWYEMPSFLGLLTLPMPSLIMNQESEPTPGSDGASQHG